MKISFFVILCLFACNLAHAQHMLIENGSINNKLSPKWIDALRSRMSKEKLDSFAKLKRPLTKPELEWQSLITSKISKWNTFRDSLIVPFGNVNMHDTIYILTGYTGVDDGFTYQFQTVCLDLTALQSNYGNASLPENNDRIDRIFAHEFTHLIHKEWARQHNYQPASFRDSILWECLYEGIGMYRSFSKKWLPVNGSLLQATIDAMQELTPVFIDNIRIVNNNPSLTTDQKKLIQANLSRGPVNKKWGAFPVGIWLALEANGKDKNLIQWMNLGPEAVIRLANKYLNASL